MRELSVTDVECQWKKTSTPKVTLPVSELYPQVEDTYNPLARDISMEDVAWFRSALQGTQCGMAWLLSPQENPCVLAPGRRSAPPTDRDLSYFVVWTTKEALVIPIPKDPAWGQNLVVLEEFYQQHILPVLISRED